MVQNQMTINLALGHYNVVDGHRVMRVPFNDMVYPIVRYRFDVREYEEGKLPISEAYQTCLDAGLGQDEIIDTLVQLYFPLRFFRVGDYEKMVLALGFIGTRGSGKTCSAVIVASCDFLLRNLPVWSNVPIRIRVVYKDAEKIFTSRDLDELNMLDLTQEYGGGLVLYDEINMEAAEASRYASTANLRFSYAMQQIRKRRLSFIWTCQGWSWIDNRLRWQTDFCISCRDASFEKKKYASNGIGDTTIWRVHDLSGTSGKFDYDFELKHRYLTDYLIGSHKVWMRPWWLAYDTGQLQGQHDYVKDYKVAEKQKVMAEANRLPQPVGELPAGPETTIEAAIDEVIASSGGTAINCDVFWAYIGTRDRSVQTRAGRLWIAKGYDKKGNSKSGYYWIKREA